MFRWLDRRLLLALMLEARNRVGARLGVRGKLVVLSVAILLVVSFSFTALSLALFQGWVGETLRDRAIVFAREIAATIKDRRELESSRLLHEQVQRILEIRPNVLQLDILTFGRDGTTVVATSHPEGRLPFTRRETQQVRSGRLITRHIRDERGRYWEVMAPVQLEGQVAGAVAARFSVDRADRLATRIRTWAFTLTAVSVVVMGTLMGLAVHFVVDRPLRRFMEAIARVGEGREAVRVRLGAAGEFGVLASHFNEMLARINRFSEELETRVKEATEELDHRYREVHRLNELLFETQRRLSHAERLALSGRLMAEVAHEVGTPLHSVAGHLELLRKDLPSDLLTEDGARRFAIIETQVARMIEIITQLLDLSRRAAGRPGPVGVNRLVRDMAELVRPSLSARGVTLDVATSPELPPVKAYPSELQQVILNLLTNALDATPAGGRIEVTTRAVPDREEVEIAVSDTGRGIPAAHRKQIFEPFFSTKEPGQGTGLGLFISAQIVRDHHGRLDVESDEGRGSTFRVVLPVGEGPA